MGKGNGPRRRADARGSPNQAMHYLFVIAKAAKLMPKDDAEADPKLRIQNNMME